MLGKMSFGLMLFCLVAASEKPHHISSITINPNSLGKYIMLSIPQSSLNIGGKWDNRLKRTTTNGLDEKYLKVSGSYKMFYTDQLKKIKTSVESEFKRKLLGLNVGLNFGSNSGSTLDLQELTTVMVENIEVMEVNPGASYLIGALKAGTVELSSVDAKTRKALLDIKTISDPEFKVRIERGLLDTTTLEFSGENLFIGVMAVKIKRSKDDVTEMTIRNEESVYWNPGGFANYQVRIEPFTVEDEKEMTTKPDRWPFPRKEGIACSSKLVIDGDGSNVANFRVDCSYGDNREYTFHKSLSDAEYLALSFELDNLKVWRNTLPKRFNGDFKFRVKRSSIVGLKE